MRKIANFLLILLPILFIILSILIFAMSNTLAFKYTIVSVFIFILLATLYWIRYSHLKAFKNLLFTFALAIITYISVNLYTMATEIYPDGSNAIWMNGQIMTKEDRTHFTTLLSSLNKHHAHVQEKPTYTMTFSRASDFDPRHLHVFRNEGLVYQGCLLGLEGGLELDGYKLTKEADKMLEKLNHTYQPLIGQ